ncbi:hypothetical protein ATANTOWER_031798 [Ataeniobius toweri]|uniref:Transposase n=1 Tax=Ataeniobius toweri TaxID=208326 RepID=A0ABU7C159_9TELE|nr:hypothetical protein [Ataeniobius toweri]
MVGQTGAGEHWMLELVCARKSKSSNLPGRKSTQRLPQLLLLTDSGKSWRAAGRKGPIEPQRKKRNCTHQPNLFQHLCVDEFIIRPRFCKDSDWFFMIISFSRSSI